MQQVAQSTRRILVVAAAPYPCPGLADEVARRALETPSEVVVVAPALDSANEQVRVAIDELRDLGVLASGTVGASDPITAIEDALVDYSATEIIIAMHPPTRSHWLEPGLIKTAKTRFELPIVEFVLED